MTTLSSTPRVLSRPTLAIVGLLTLTACSSSSGSGTGATTTTTTTKTGTGGGTTTTSSTSTNTMTCPPAMTYGGGEMTTSSSTVTAKIVDETGAPVVGQPLYICGTNLCSPPGMTQAGGAASISSTLSLKKAAFKVGDALAYAELGIPLTMATTDFTAGGTKVINTGKLSNKTGAALTPGTDAVSGDVTVTIAAGASVGVNPLVYDTPDKQLFRSVSIPVANEGPVFASAGVSGFELFYGVAPAGTTLCAAAKITVALPHATMTPNDLGWAPGTAVEFWVTSVDTGQIYAPYAGWAKMSDGAVSADGKTVATSDGKGFISLEHFAIRKAP
jgi:hypothetical protein